MVVVKVLSPNVLNYSTNTNTDTDIALDLFEGWLHKNRDVWV